MVTQMWEPHQTSAFLNAIFIKIYMALTGTTTGIALYLNIVGLGVKLGVTYIFYQTFRKYCDKNILFLMCSFFMTVNAKNYMILDFSNMMVYFSVFLCCCLFVHFQKQKAGEQKEIFLILAASCFCLEALSYPSSIILFPMLLVILHQYSMSKNKDVLLFSVVCFIFGAAFLGYLIIQSGWECFWISIKYILIGDDSHQVGRFATQIKVYIAEMGSLIVLFCICAFIAFFIGKMFTRNGGTLIRFCYAEIFLAVLLFINFIQILINVTENGFSVTFRLLYVASYVPILILGFKLKKYCSKEEQMLFNIGTILSIGGGVAVLVLTNLTLLTTVAYLILGVMVSLIPLGEYLHKNKREEKNIKVYGIIILFLLVIIFKNGYVLRATNRLNASVFSIQQVIKAGPMAGIFTDYMGGYMRNSNLDDWKQYVHEGDKILIVGYPVSAIGYLYENTEICVDSTICTPTYNEKLLEYWKMNPWKEPNVVVLDCWYGEPHIAEDTWIMGWIEENFDFYEDGKYVRIYRREL